jgi:hypothetical protein
MGFPGKFPGSYDLSAGLQAESAFSRDIDLIVV